MVEERQKGGSIVLLSGKKKIYTVEDFREDDVLRQENYIILQRILDVDDSMKLIVLKLRKSVSMSQMMK